MIDCLKDGCGDALFETPVSPELSGPRPVNYERNPLGISVMRLRFQYDPLTPEAIVRLVGGLAVRQPVSFEAFGTPEGIVHEVVCQREERSVVIDGIRSALGSVAVHPVPAKEDVLYRFLEPLRRSRRRPAFNFRDYHIPPPFFLPLINVGPSVGSLYEVLSRVTSDGGCLALWQVLLLPARRQWWEPVRDYLAKEEVGTRTSVATGNLLEKRTAPGPGNQGGHVLPPGIQ